MSILLIYSVQLQISVAYFCSIGLYLLIYSQMIIMKTHIWKY